jgi:hypothetical protein
MKIKERIDNVGVNVADVAGRVVDVQRKMNGKHRNWCNVVRAMDNSRISLQIKSVGLQNMNVALLQTGFHLSISRRDRAKSSVDDKRGADNGCSSLKSSKTGLMGRRWDCGVPEFVSIKNTQQVQVCGELTKEFAAGAGKTILVYNC